MRIDHEEPSTLRQAAKSWGPATDAPTFLPADTIDEAAPQRRDTRSPKSDSVMTSAPKPARGSNPAVPASPAAPVIPAQQQPLVAPVAAPAAPAQEPPFVAFDGGASFDPLALPLPPELATPVYDWLRRLALQTELAAADRLLRDALADLTSSLSAVIIYKGADGLYTLGAADELPKDPTAVIAVGKARRALVGTHSAFVPVCTSTETIAVIQLTRNGRQQAFGMVEHLVMAAIAREGAAIMHHLVANHAQERAEAEQDKKGLYRAEALKSHRNRGQEGVLAELSPGWVKRTYHVLMIALVAAAAFAYIVEVPTYSSGEGVIVFDGARVTAMAPGTVDKILVTPGQKARKGTPLVRFKADKEEADLAQATAELNAAKQQYLIDSSDETLRKTLISAQAATKRAQDALDQKTVHADAEGIVSDIRIKPGDALEFGAPILQLIVEGSEPYVLAYLPGSDRPRMRTGYELQVELIGYQKTRERGTISEVANSATGAAEAKRAIGAELADSVKLPEGSYVLVKAKLPARTFRFKGRDLNYHPGMRVKTDVKLESKRFIVTLLPSLEKYVP